MCTEGSPADEIAAFVLRCFCASGGRILSRIFLFAPLLPRLGARNLMV